MSQGLTKFARHHKNNSTVQVCTVLLFFVRFCASSAQLYNRSSYYKLNCEANISFLEREGLGAASALGGEENLLYTKGFLYPNRVSDSLER